MHRTSLRSRGVGLLLIVGLAALVVSIARVTLYRRAPGGALDPNYDPEAMAEHGDGSARLLPTANGEQPLHEQLRSLQEAVAAVQQHLAKYQVSAAPSTATLSPAAVAKKQQTVANTVVRARHGAPEDPTIAHVVVGDEDDAAAAAVADPAPAHGKGGAAHRGDLEDSIFVSIASYRDDQCAPTIQDMFERAKRPHALFVGAVEQHFPQDPSCIPASFQACQASTAFCPSDHIQVRRIPPNLARGPTFGRYFGMLMYRGETYLFMMDSHNRFVTGWDSIIVRMYKSLPTEKGVLSHYPEAWNNPADGQSTNAPLDNRKTTTYLCTAKFINEGFPRLDGFVVHKGAKPRPQPWAAAGFLFADARMLTEVPFDPNLNYIFDGEEILYSVRMWTHGWDIFSPNENIMYHYYYRRNAKKFWSLLPPDWTTHRDRALRRIQFLLNVTKAGTGERVVPLDTTEEWVTKDLDKYGLGTARSLREYYEWAGIDHVARKIENKWCPRA